jgi:hypothetical protein
MYTIQFDGLPAMPLADCTDAAITAAEAKAVKIMKKKKMPLPEDFEEEGLDFDIYEDGTWVEGGGSH